MKANTYKVIGLTITSLLVLSLITTMVINYKTTKGLQEFETEKEDI